MGGGSYSYTRSSVTSSSYVGQSREQVFRSSRMPGDMNPKGLNVRESCDSDEHPESFPIIIGMDVTGSMGHVPHSLITGTFNTIMKNIMDSGIQHPQVLFCAFGDLLDEAPLQVGQFESSDQLLDHWLKSVWLEGGGWGNGKEANELPIYLAAYHTKIDSMIVRGKKGVLITIGDDGIGRNLSISDIEKVFGPGNNHSERTDLPVKEAYQKALESWDIYHIHLLGSCRGDHIQETYRNIGFDMSKFITTEHDAKGVGDIITKVIIDSYNDSPVSVSMNSEKPSSHPLL